jgi:uncharacterized protein
MMNSLQFLLIDLFRELRSPPWNLKLTLEQFDLLCQAVAVSSGLKNWEQLRRICRLVWVKPHENYDSDRFEKAFDAYIDKCQAAIQELQAQVPSEPVLKPEFRPGVRPPIPPRVFTKAASKKSPSPNQLETSPKMAMTAVKTKSQVGSQFVLRQLPLTLRDLKQLGQSLRQPMSLSQELELDLEATLDSILREGFLNDVVQRPVRRRQAELLLLIDDDNPMIPFRPALQPLIQAAREHRLAQSRIYRFTTYPVQYLYPWERPTQAVAVSTILARLHRQRTVAIIVSDAGAAYGTYNGQRVKRTGEFLAKLLPCVRDILWLNPVPSHRWKDTTAAALASALAGRMIPLDPVQVQQVARGQMLETGVQLWSLNS